MQHEFPYNCKYSLLETTKHFLLLLIIMIMITMLDKIIFILIITLQSYDDDTISIIFIIQL